MGDVVVVDDPGDPRLHPYRDLTDAALRRGYDEQNGLFVAEGELVIRQVAACGGDFRSLLLSPRLRARLADLVAAIAAPVYEAPQAVLEAVAGFNVHRGALAVVSRPAPRPLDAVVAGARRVLVVEAVTDQENLGSLFRNAAALGAHSVVVDPSSADPLYRRCVRVSMGHVLTLPWVRSEVLGAVEVLRARGHTIVALTPDGDVALDDALLAERDRVALVVGAEGPGLSDAALRAADLRVRISMTSGVDSLNVATAAAIALHAARPRGR